MILPLFFTGILAVVQGQFDTKKCEPGWTLFNGWCYKFHNNPSQSGNYDYVQGICRSEGAAIVALSSQAEKDYIDAQTKSFTIPQFADNWLNGNSFLLLGLHRDVNNPSGPWIVDTNETIPAPDWCPTQPNSHIYGIEDCSTMVSNWTPALSCLHDVPCVFRPNPWYRFYCKKQFNCVENAERISFTGPCTCKPNYADTTGKDLKCVAKNPCMMVNNSLAILFIIDSSSSIGEENWDYIVQFLRSGAKYITNKARVGFIKYGTDVTYSKWVDAGWDEKEFKRKVPEVYDDGETNTVAALNEAVQMFKKDESRSQVAVLITDGLPFTSEYKDNKEEALSTTQNAAKQLLESSAYLIALGYGKELHKNDGEKFLKSLLEDPREDYFEFRKEACDLKESHMANLLRKVCRRFI